VRLLADPVRWLLMRELASGDRRVRELAAAAGQPQNLVSYHLRQLRAGGLVNARRSSFDRRDTYYSLDLRGCARELAGAASALHPGLAPPAAAVPERAAVPAAVPGRAAVPAAVPGRAAVPAAVPGRAAVPAAPGRAAVPGAARPRVLFVCTGNSGRSPMAEGLLAHRAGARVEAASAGIRPRPLHPDAVAVMRDRYRIDISGHRPAPVEAAARERFDYVISLCDKAREACPPFPGMPRLVHWSLPDPAAGEDSPAGYPAFERNAAELDSRIGFLLPVLDQAAPAAR
jgi:ArsR family transcriptional regulator, arsenate/arsenite/antimonite-responsive transcriptional repressor / arsenate reductase (thioredoxin)